MAKQVEISDVWVHRVKSPLYLVVSACTGIAPTFCLLFIHMNGNDGYPFYHPFVLINVAVIWFVFWFYTGLAKQAIDQIRESNKKALFSDENLPSSH